MTKTMGKMSVFLQMSMALDDALTSYRREFNDQLPHEEDDDGDEPELSDALLAEFKHDHPGKGR